MQATCDGNGVGGPGVCVCDAGYSGTPNFTSTSATSGSWDTSSCEPVRRLGIGLVTSPPGDALTHAPRLTQLKVPCPEGYNGFVPGSNGFGGLSGCSVAGQNQDGTMLGGHTPIVALSEAPFFSGGIVPCPFPGSSGALASANIPNPI